jgi:hypothetical protein
MDKQCGDCSLCCKVLDIYELEKPRDTWCEHVVLWRGCAIYNERPPSCAAFQCLWLIDPKLGDIWKPNKSKMVIVPETPLHVVVYVDKGARQPWMQEPYFSTLRAMSASGINAGGMVTVVENGETIVILPDRGVRLGKLKSDDRILMGERTTPHGPEFEVRVVKADQVDQFGKVGVGWTKPPNN